MLQSFKFFFLSQAKQHFPNPSQWLRLYGDYLFSIAMMKLDDRQLAEDMVQETFLSAIKGAHGFKGESSEKTWLTSILNNKIIDQYRKKSALKNTQEYIQATDTAFTDSFFESAPAIPHWLDETAPRNWGPGADQSINEREFELVLQACIKKMPEKLMVVFLAKFIEEETSENICKELNITSSNYWVIVHRAKVLVRSCLEKNWFLK